MDPGEREGGGEGLGSVEGEEDVRIYCVGEERIKKQNTCSLIAVFT